MGRGKVGARARGAQRAAARVARRAGSRDVRLRVLSRSSGPRRARRARVDRHPARPVRALGRWSRVRRRRSRSHRGSPGQGGGTSREVRATGRARGPVREARVRARRSRGAPRVRVAPLLPRENDNHDPRARAPRGPATDHRRGTATDHLGPVRRRDARPGRFPRLHPRLGPGRRLHLVRRRVLRGARRPRRVRVHLRRRPHPRVPAAQTRRRRRGDDSDHHERRR